MCASDLQGLNAGLLGSIHIILDCIFYLYMYHIMFTIDLNKIISISLSLSLSLSGFANVTLMHMINLNVPLAATS